ncbi:MAG TPA: hypothetical protein VHP83_01555 [Aggregatilineaceae bacterium]|nr:hypothetical protein [Aggregatilineaceae bacterium]
MGVGHIGVYQHFILSAALRRRYFLPTSTLDELHKTAVKLARLVGLRILLFVIEFKLGPAYYATFCMISSRYK